MRTLAFAALVTLGSCTKEEVRAETPKAAAAASPLTARVLELSVTGEGFEPSKLTVKRGEALTLRVTRKTDETCATELLIDGTDINVPLPLGETVSVNWTPAKAGAVKFGCAMDKMIGGVLLVE